MEQVNFSYGSFNINFRDGSNIWYLAIHPEMVPAKEGIRPSGNYFVYCIHPIHGSVSLIIEQDENCSWSSKKRPPFFSSQFVEWIGYQIENYSR